MNQTGISNTMENKRKRIVIVHRHLFKNAGTTFDFILEKNFKGSFCDHRDDAPMRKIGPDYLIQYLSDHPQIRALSSHHIWFNMPGHDTLDLIPVMFLRHPIERMRSVYNFENKQQSDTLGSKMAKLLTFRDYVLWYMKTDSPATIRDFHTRYLAGIRTAKPLQKKHFKKAKKEILNNHLIGVVDLFDQSLQVFTRVFNDRGIELDICYQPKNVNSPFENADYEERAEEVLNELGNAAKEVLKKNAFDMELYKIAREKIEREASRLNLK